MAGDNSSGAGGSWNINNDVWVCADTNGDASEWVSKCMEVISGGGYNAINGGVGPDSKYAGVNQGKTNLTVLYLVNGVCKGTCYEFYMEAKEDGWRTSGSNIVVGFQTGPMAVCTDAEIHKKEAGSAWDDNFSTASMQSEMVKDSSAGWLEKAPNCGWVSGPDPESLANAFLTGSGSGGGGGAGVVEGELYSHEGETPEFWNAEQYTPYLQVPFTNFTIEEENPRIRTASFETPEEIDLTQGRVAVLITGDCNDFGGIIIKKDYDSQTKIYKYQCQGFMERIMSSPVNVVANGGRTAHNLIKSYLSKIGLPDVNLGEPEDYDVLVDEELQRLLLAEMNDAESSDVFNGQEDFLKAVGKTGAKKKTAKQKDEDTASSAEQGTKEKKKKKNEDGDEEDDDAVPVVTETESLNEDASIINTFKRKPVGIYDKKTGGDYIRTMIFDYGINVDFYGDVNGIPHFDVMDMDTWTRTGWYISPDMGFDSNYDYCFNITDVVTQVGVKNVSAINGNGELYTAKELLGVDLERFVGRMGTIVDNPSGRGTAGKEGSSDDEEEEEEEETEGEDGETTEGSEDSSTDSSSSSSSSTSSTDSSSSSSKKKKKKKKAKTKEDLINQLRQKLQESETEPRVKIEVLDTEGEPSCQYCAYKNGGFQPTMKTYYKSWLNECPGCGEINKLTSVSDLHGKTVCGSCGKVYCQYCGYCRTNNRYQLHELFREFEKSGRNQSS